jgi:type II secretory pathway pseudopilin PulG
MRISNRHPGFTLPAVLVVVGALLILAVGVLLVASIERDTARSFVDRQRAELAARAGLEDLRGLLVTEAANDDFVVLQSTLQNPITPGMNPAPHLFIGRGQESVDSSGMFNFRYIPLFSTRTKPTDAPFKTPEIDGLTGGANDSLEFTTLPHHDKVRASWLPVLDEKGRTVARYAYWVEDLQARVDPTIAGNKHGSAETHARVAWPFPAAGLNDRPESSGEPALDQIALFALDPAATDAAQGELAKTLLKNRPLLVSPDSQLAAAGIRPPLDRLKTVDPASGGMIGDLIDPKARAVERGLVAGIRPYLEQPLVPHAQGIHPSAAGQPKLNLNKLLETGGSSAVDEMGDFIKKALPNFEQRKGGFPEDYLKTLAANAIDYADVDNDSTQRKSQYRGIDGFPLVSEYIMKTRWEDVLQEDGRKFLILSVTVYVELWNMTNVPVSGSAQVSYETQYQFQIPPNPNFINLGDLSKAKSLLVELPDAEVQGSSWFPPLNVSLQPNEYRLYNCGTVTYTYDAVSASEWIASPLTLSGETYAARGSGYRMLWNGSMVDLSGGGVHRNDSSLNFPADTKNNPRQRVRLTIPGHSHWRGVSAPRDNNMGDPRMSRYLLSPQDANVYPQNYSPNRRNIREGSVYNSASRHNLVYGRVLPSEWPDGGHDSPFGTASMHGLLNMSAGAFADDHRIEPDDPRFFNQLPNLTLGSLEAPVRLSNLGRFFSVTELGHIYDPVMWQVRGNNDTNNRAGNPWGDVLSSSAASPNLGGGNTLRIGRPEHPGFEVPGKRASHLLDLFHTGLSRSEDSAKRAGPVTEIKGHLNLNTASKQALRQVLAGRLKQDPEMRRFINDSHDQNSGRRFPLVQKLSPTGSPAVPDITAAADRIADAIIRSRPYASTGELANTREQNSTRVFGNQQLLSGFTTSNFPILQWTDAAAEETFARAFEASTVRSRNFRIWVVGQSVAPTTATNASPEVLAEVRKVFTVFADPGERKPDGAVDPAKFRLRILHENDF